MIDSAQLTDRIIGEIASRILNDDDLDMLDAFNSCAALLTADAFLKLAAYMDLCPFHRRDIEICDDDGMDCTATITASLPKATIPDAN